MFTAYATPSLQYQRVDVESSVGQASPLRLVVMLYDGAIRNINEAIAGIRSGNVAAKGRAITKATRILEEGLRSSLDQRAGAISTNLDELYRYMTTRLLAGHRHNDEAPLLEVLELLHSIRTAWHALEQEQAA